MTPDPARPPLAEALGASEVRHYGSHDEAVRAEMARRAPQEPVGDAADRIRRNVEHWDGLGGEGTYIADEVDYGKIDVAILRDIRRLLDALAAEKAAHEETREQLGCADEELVAAETALDQALAERDGLREALDGWKTAYIEYQVKFTRDDITGAEDRAIADRYYAANEALLAALATTPSTEP